MDKLHVMNEIDEILNTYCEGCFLKKHFTKENSKTVAHKYCITQCTVGEHLQYLGRELNKFIK